MPSRRFTLEGRARTEAGFDEALVNTVTPAYFKVMDIGFRDGSGFADLTDTVSPAQAIVNEEFVRRYVGSGGAVGRRVEVRGRNYTIAGIVRNSLYNAFGEPPMPIVYLSYRDNPQPRGEIHLRLRARQGRGNDTLDKAATAIGLEARRVLRELDPELPVFNLRSLTEHVETNLVFRRVPARMFAVLGPLLLTLAAIGIYATVAYAVSLRTTEIGVRLAVGGTARRVVAHFVGQHLGIVGAGVIAGWTIAFIVALDVIPGGRIDLPVFAGVPAILLLVAGCACWLPARRAVSVDPVSALRQE
jgi:hypothetical protein